MICPSWQHAAVTLCALADELDTIPPRIEDDGALAARAQFLREPERRSHRAARVAAERLRATRRAQPELDERIEPRVGALWLFAADVPSRGVLARGLSAHAQRAMRAHLSFARSNPSLAAELLSWTELAARSLDRAITLRELAELTRHLAGRVAASSSAALRVERSLRVRGESARASERAGHMLSGV